MTYLENRKPLDIMCGPRVVNYYDNTCLISGEEIPKMKHSLELCKSYYESLSLPICVNMNGLETLEDSIFKECSTQEFDKIKIKRELPKPLKCRLCSCDDPLIQFRYNKTDRIMLTICRNCLKDKVQKGKEKLRVAEKKCLYHDSLGFVIQKSGREELKEIQSVVNGNTSLNSDMCITFGTYKDCNKIHFPIEDIENIIKILDSRKTEGSKRCGLCKEREEYISLPLCYEKSHKTIKICKKCRNPIKEKLENFLVNNNSTLIANII